MEKLKPQTPNLVHRTIEQIARLFPQVVTETRDDHGAVKQAVDFDLLRQALSNVLVEDENERYRLDWPGKKASLLKANLPITKTLRPVVAESVDFETTKNLFIEGDNFEVLKILQESYLGKIKMIYIDPPYNTGNDFIYKDDFKMSKDAYEEQIGVLDEEGGKLFKNTDSNGRFHSDWLSMMYERLVIARDLLKDDGVIFISIDDNEVANLRKICDEVFGEENFSANFIIKSNPRGSQSTIFSATVHEHLLCYVKNTDIQLGFSPPLNEIMESEYNLNDDKGQYRLLGLRLRGGAWRKEDSPLLYYPFYIDPNSGSLSLEKDKIHSYKVLPIKPSTNEESTWRWSKEKVIKEKDLIIAKKVNRDEEVVWDIYQKDYLYLENGEQKETKVKTIWDEKEVNYQNGANEIKELFDNKSVFNFPKPTFLLYKCLRIEKGKDGIILDFFSGSATTAHAVMQLNAEDGGSRKFIMVQLLEKTDENSEAYKAGYKTIADIGKERIRRAGKKILAELTTKDTKKEEANLFSEAEAENFRDVRAFRGSKNLDIGFRVYKTDSSNMEEVFYHPTELTQDQLSLLQSNIKEDRTPEDLLTQVILDLGLELSLPIQKKQMAGNTVFFVQHNALVACFDEEINFETTTEHSRSIVDEIADVKPFKVVFRDACFKDDNDRINVEERFKRRSPETVVNVI